MDKLKIMNRSFAVIAAITLFIISCKKDDLGPPPTAPLVQTAALTNVAASSGTATAGGSIVSDGGEAITQSGVVWSKTNAAPSLTDSMVTSTATTGAFTVNINGIDFGQTYYFRAFATNSIGTGYGDVVTLTTSNDSVKFTYNEQEVVYGIITSPTTGKKWLDRNIGATRAAISFDDYQAYGDLFQWGRPADGHQLINWTNATTGAPVNGTTTDVATDDVPGHSNYIVGNWPPDWRDDNNTNRWAVSPQGPCPVGWHIPSKSEWQAEVVSGGLEDRVSAYNILKLTCANFRRDDNGQIQSSPTGTMPGKEGWYWSSTTNFEAFDNFYDVLVLQIPETSSVQVGGLAMMAQGLSVRCIKD